MEYTRKDIRRYKRFSGTIYRYELGGYSLIYDKYSLGSFWELYDWKNEKVVSFEECEKEKAIRRLIKEANSGEIKEG